MSHRAPGLAGLFPISRLSAPAIAVVGVRTLRRPPRRNLIAERRHRVATQLRFGYCGAVPQWALRSQAAQLSPAAQARLRPLDGDAGLPVEGPSDAACSRQPTDRRSDWRDPRLHGRGARTADGPVRGRHGRSRRIALPRALQSALGRRPTGTSAAARVRPSQEWLVGLDERNQRRRCGCVLPPSPDAVVCADARETRARDDGQESRAREAGLPIRHA
jgi:hypothetical protein